VGGGDYGSIKVDSSLLFRFPTFSAAEALMTVHSLRDMWCLRKVSRAILLNGSSVTRQRHDAEKQ
jgi:hypothetical protein